MMELIAIGFFKFIFYFQSAVWWARLDSAIQDKAHRESRLDFGIGSNKVSRVWLRGLLIASLAISTNPTYFVLVFLGLSLMWIPLFNTLLASMRKYNDDSPELGDSGIDKWFQKHLGLYKAYKIVGILVGLSLFIIAHTNLAWNNF